MDRLAVILHVAFCLTVLVAQTCSSSSWARKVLYRSKRQDECQHSNQFRCTSGACIDAFSVCDGTKECTDGSDETENVCKQLNIKCPALTFNCAYGACIDGNKKCDGQVDCADGSDETAPACTTTTSPVTDSVSSNCKTDEFKCKSGQCINEFSVCDGKVNCEDGSDETTAQCSSIGCPKFAFRCSYGGCVEAAARCNGSKDCADSSDEDPDVCKTPSDPTVISTPLPETRGGCLLPQHPEFGSYTAPACEHDKTPCRLVPGTPVPQHWLLSYKCNDGYYINGTREDEVFLFCINGNWSGKIPVCKKMCSPLISLSVAVKCQYQGDDIDCSKPMRPQTRAIGSCKPSYESIRPPPYHDIFCRENGKWSYDLFSCHPVCGKRNVESANTPLIIDGVPTKQGEFPWHVGLYMKNNNDWVQKCGGSLISPHIVLTAAHCVFQENIRKTLSPTDVKVGLGKYHREWTHDDPGAVKSDVREIIIPPRYYGKPTSYAQDIALLDLTHSVQINTNIMPVCVDWNRQITITPGTLGMLVGWGGTENGSFSDVLLYAELPYIENKQCISKISEAFQHFVTPDKFCAGSTNGSGAAKGDSGGGLTFLQNNLHYVYGIVSTKVHKERSVATFTDVSNTELLTWLNNMKKRFDEVHLET